MSLLENYARLYLIITIPLVRKSRKLGIFDRKLQAISHSLVIVIWYILEKMKQSLQMSSLCIEVTRYRQNDNPQSWNYNPRSHTNSQHGGTSLCHISLWPTWISWNRSVCLVQIGQGPHSNSIFKFPVFSQFFSTANFPCANFSDLRMFHAPNWLGRHIQFLREKMWNFASKFHNILDL